MFLAEYCARGVSWSMVGTWASPGMGRASGWGACLVAMSAEELDQTLSCVISTRRDVSGSKLNHVDRAVRCRGPSWVCKSVSISGITSSAPLLHMHLSDSPKFSLPFQLAM